MKKFISFVFAGFATLCLSSCGAKKEKAVEESSAPKYLVVYYSQTGATKSVAEEIQQQLNADCEAIEMVEPYDNEFNSTINRCKEEMAQGITPAINPIKADLKQYDTIFLGFPVWFGTYALPVATFLKEADLTGKTIVPFCTFGSGGLETSVKALQEALPEATIATGYGVRNARLAAMPKELSRFLIEQGYKDGEVEPLPAFSAQQPVSEEEKAIFEAATGNYQFPLGTPVTVGKRTTADGTDYEFTASAKDIASGADSSVTIYVTVGTEDNAQPEFTRVVR